MRSYYFGAACVSTVLLEPQRIRFPLLYVFDILLSEDFRQVGLAQTLGIERTVHVRGVL